MLETSEGFRKARGKLAIVSAVSIAWGAAQIEIGAFTLAGITSNVTSSNTVFFGLLALLLYFGSRTSLEFAMQEVDVRRWRLAQLDFHLSFILFRVSLLILSVSIVNRDQSVAFKAISGVLIFFLIFLVVFVAIYFIFSLVYVTFRTAVLNGSAATSVFMSMGYSMAISFMIMIIIIIDQVYSFGYFSFIPRFLPLNGSLVHTIFLSVVLITLFLSFFRADILLHPLFAYVPKRIGEHYTEDGRQFYKEDWNPEHPDYENLKSNDRFSGPLVAEKLPKKSDDLDESPKDS